MSRICNSISSIDPFSISRRSVETFKPEKHDASTLIANAKYLLDNPTIIPFNFTNYPIGTTTATAPIQFPEIDSWCSTIPSDVAEMALTIDDIVDCSRVTSPKLSSKRGRSLAASSLTASPLHTSCVHERPADDMHYPYNVQRKSRTKMRSGVCVWCAVQALMSLPDRPVLRKRTSGSDADWERWMRELASSRRSGFLRYLAQTLMPKHEILAIIDESQLGELFKELAGALIEMALREHRREVVEERSIMAQVRSSKYHKSARVAKIIESFYQ